MVVDKGPYDPTVQCNNNIITKHFRVVKVNMLTSVILVSLLYLLLE